MIDPDRLDTISTDALISLQKKINKELEKRSGGEIKKLRTQMGKLAKALGYDLVPTSPDLSEDTDKPKRRGRRRKTEEQAPEVAEERWAGPG